MKHKLELSLLGEISVASDMQAYGRKWTHVQALARPAAPAQPGEKEAHRFPRSGLLFHPRLCCWGAEEVTDRLRLSRALGRCRGQEQTCACGSAFAWECGPPSWSPGWGERALREHHPEALFSPAWKQSALDAGKAWLRQGRRGSQPARVCKRPLDGTGEVSQRENTSSAQRPEMPEAERSMPPPLHSLAVTSRLQVVLPHEGAGCGSVSDVPGALPGVRSARAFPLELSPRPPRRGGAHRLSPHCQGLELWGLCQREGKSRTD